MRLSAALTAIAFASGAFAAPQTPAPQRPLFRAGIDLVQLDVSVYDKDHHPLKGLTASDFTLLEDDKLRPIEAFSAVDIPDPPEPSVPWVRDAAFDVANNDKEDRRLFVVVLDDASWGQSMFGLRTAERAKEVARSIVRRLAPGDLAAVVFTGDNRHSQDLIADHARLLKAIDSLASTSIPPELLRSYAIEVLRRAADVLIGSSGRRKALIDVTAFDFEWVPPNHPPSLELLNMRAQTEKIFEAAQRANVNAYMVRPGEHDPDQYSSRLLADHWEATWFPRVAHETGGEAMVAGPTTTESAVARIFEANSSYYVLAYASADHEKFHRVAVKVDRPDVEIRARDKYFWPEPEKAPNVAPPALEKSTSGVLPNSDLPMRTTAAPFASPGQPGATVAIVTNVHQPADGHAARAEDVDVSVRAFTVEGEPHGSTTQSVRVSPRQERSGEVEYNVLAQLPLKPGAYELRFSAHSGAQNLDGSVYTTVEVPDFAKLPVSLSGVAIDVTPNITSAPKDALASILPVIPTTQREFVRSDRATAFVRVYEGGKSPIAPVPLHVRIVNDQDAEVLDTTETLAATRFSTQRAADYRLDLPLAKLAPGRYLLTFDTTMGKTTTRREVRISVR